MGNPRLLHDRVFFAPRLPLALARAVALVALASFPLPPAALPAATLLPDDDVTVRPGRGNLDESAPLGLLVKADGSASFIEFTLGDAAASRATLRLHNWWSNGSAPVDYDVRVRGAPWSFDERTLTHATQPDDSAWVVLVDSFYVGNAPGSFSFEITDFYNAHLGETVTVSLRSVRGTGDGPIFDDREGTDGHAEGPSIEVVDSGGPPDPLVGGGWAAHYYKPAGEVTSFPDLDALVPRAAAVVPAIDAPHAQGQLIPQGIEFVEDFAVRYEGRITLPEGATAFHLLSDDGARLTIDGELVVENEGGGGLVETSATVTLEGGEHCAVVEYFQHEGAAGIRLEYTPPGGERALVPPSVLRPDPCSSGAITVPRWGMLEVSLTASSRPVNPFTDVELSAEVTAPDGRTLQVGGYFDGDGRGGQDGNIWKLRLVPDQAGSWQWSATSDDPFLNGQEGSFDCLPSDDPGPVVAEGRHFRFAAGEPVFLLGNFLDRAAPANQEFSHTLLSEEISESDREDMIFRHRSVHRANKMNVYLANRGDYGGIATTPWLGSSTSNDPSRFDLARWRRYDEVVARLGDEGMIAELWFFADDSGFGDLSDALRQRLIRYGMARLSPYAHTMFVLALEWQEGWSAAEVRGHAEFLQAHNAWGRLASVHGTTGNFAFPGEAWADFMATQSGNSIDPAGNNTHTIANRALAEKPLIVEEFGILDAATDGRLRGNLWAAFCGGAAGTGTGSELSRLRTFIETTGVPFWRMTPDNAVASRGFALIEGGAEYVVYVESGGELTVDLPQGEYRAEWFNPRASGGDEPVTAGDVAGGEQRFATPDGADWVLHISARGAETGLDFVRGDSNSDGETDLSDGVFTLSYLFLGEDAPECEKSADTDDSGLVDISDAISLLGHLFLGEPAPASPYPDCGPDVSEDSLPCASFPPCEPTP